MSVNVAAGSKVTFELTYEELLKRHKGKYEMYIKVQPKQLVRHFEVSSHACSPCRNHGEPGRGRAVGAGRRRRGKSQSRAKGVSPSPGLCAWPRGVGKSPMAFLLQQLEAQGRRL